MRSTGKSWRYSTRVVLVSAIMAMAASHAYSQQATAPKKAPSLPVASESRIQASAILRRMAEFLGAAQRFSVNVSAGYDAVQTSGEKIEFGETRKITLRRPDRLRVEGERSDGAKMLTVFTGKEIMLADGASNVYATAPQPGNLDQSIVYFVRDLGMRLPLAVLLLSQLPAELNERVRSVDYVERTSIRGAVSHHLAARTDAVDFQVWVADGDQPLPQRVVITYKEAKGQPQFRADLTDWNLGPAISDSTFVAKPPENAQRVAFAAQLARASVAVRKTSADKGAK
jgi:hypothetical protein